MTVGGRERVLRGGSVQLGLGAYVWFVAKTRSSGGERLVSARFCGSCVLVFSTGAWF